MENNDRLIICKPINDYITHILKEEGWNDFDLCDNDDLLVYNHKIFYRQGYYGYIERFVKLESFTNLDYTNLKKVGERNKDFIYESENLYTPENYDLFCKKIGKENKYLNLEERYNQYRKEVGHESRA